MVFEKETHLRGRRRPKPDTARCSHCRFRIRLSQDGSLGKHIKDRVTKAVCPNSGTHRYTERIYNS